MMAGGYSWREKMDFDWLSRIEATQEDGEGVLAGGGGTDLRREVAHLRLAGDEPGIAGAQPVHRGLRGHRDCVQSFGFSCFSENRGFSQPSNRINQMASTKPETRSLSTTD